MTNYLVGIWDCVQRTWGRWTSTSGGRRVLYALGLMVAFGLGMLAGHFPVWEYRDVYYYGRHQTIRTHRWTGEQQRFDRAYGYYGWVTVPQPVKRSTSAWEWIQEKFGGVSTVEKPKPAMTAEEIMALPPRQGPARTVMTTEEALALPPTGDVGHRGMTAGPNLSQICGNCYYETGNGDSCRHCGKNVGVPPFLWAETRLGLANDPSYWGVLKDWAARGKPGPMPKPNPKPPHRRIFSTEELFGQPLDKDSTGRYGQEAR